MIEEHLGQRLARPAKQAAGLHGAANFQLVIIRQIVNPADLEVRVEYAREGRHFDELDNYVDYGRYVGYHEYARTADPPPDSMPIFEDYLHNARVFCHTTGAGWKGVVWPPIEDPEDPYFYRDTDVERTPILLAFKPGSKWIILPTFRVWTAKVDASARSHDCIVEGTSA